jgi:hypothetical protein
VNGAQQGILKAMTMQSTLGILNHCTHRWPDESEVSRFLLSVSLAIVSKDVSLHSIASLRYRPEDILHGLMTTGGR